MAADKCLFHFLKQTEYNNTSENQIGTDADFLALYPSDSPLRTVPTPTGDIAYVRKFGIIFSTAGATTLADFATTTGAGESLLYTLTSADGATSFGNITDVNGVATDNTSGTIGATDGLKIVLSCSAGAAVNNETSFSINGVTIVLPDETISNGDSITFYISNTGSSYYDTSYMYGGARHTPALNDSDLPYFDIATAYAALAAANNDGVEILDSATYEEDLTTDNQAFDSSDTIVYATSGQSPTITRGVGARISREVSTQYNNTTAIYFNENGDDADAGTWQAPKLTIAGAIAARGTEEIVYGGTGAGGNGIFTEDVTTAAAYDLEADYGYTPTINGEISISTHDNNIRGFFIDGTGGSVSGITATTSNGNIEDCSIYNFTNGIYKATANLIDRLYIYRCRIYNNTKGIYWNTSYPTNNGDMKIKWNFIYNNTDGVYLYIPIAGGIWAQLEFSHNNIYNNSNYGIYVQATAGGAVIFTTENNTVILNGYGFYKVGGIININLTVRDYVIYHNTIYDLYDASGAVGQTITESNYGTNTNWTIGAGCITTDPELCKITSPYELGISANSGAYRTDTSSDDMGAHLRIIEIDAADIVLNGLKIDGQNEFNVGVFIRDTANHTGLNIKWCSIYNFQGIAIDLYDDDTDLDAIISNNLIYGNGNGGKLAYGGNTLEENNIYNNTVFGIWADYTGTTFNHNVFYLNQYGIYLESNSAGIIIKNCIFNQNSLYGIYAEIAIVITYCNIPDSVNSNVDITDSSNIVDNPLFINTTSGSENFNIKTIEAGYILDSASKDASDSTTFPDIGAYDIARSTANEWWQKYQLATNPTNMNAGIIAKSLRDIEEGLGSKILYSKSHKRVLPFIWDANASSTEIQRKTIEYLNTLIPTREINPQTEAVLTKDNCKFRAHLQPETLHYTGTATISGATLTDATKTWIINELKGWWVGVKYASGTATGTITAATKKLLVAPSPGWTNDEWIGYYFYYNYNYYYITDNDADELTLSDPDGTLSDAAGINWTIEKYFRITRNTETVITVEDDDSELPSGSYAYYIDFIECRLQDSKFSYTQLPRFIWTKENQKSGYEIILEES